MYVRTYLHTVTTPPSCVCTYVSPPAILTALRTSTPACPAYNAVICHGVYRLTGLRSLLVFARADPILETFADSSESIEMWTYLTEVCDQDVGGWMVHEVAFYTDANCSMRIRSLCHCCACVTAISCKVPGTTCGHWRAVTARISSPAMLSIFWCSPRDAAPHESEQLVSRKSNKSDSRLAQRRRNSGTPSRPRAQLACRLAEVSLLVSQTFGLCSHAMTFHPH